eukprot:c16551_g1_i1.p1 GENE.c16551_g1_i1~~c16551_g1_i1.p1  ORF type:complete len:175 (+),score=73.42 c16551_g1_i1:48-572(+)
MRNSLFLLFCFVGLIIALPPRPQRGLSSYVVEKPQRCARVAQVGDSILVNYEGHLETLEGDKFDSSYDRNEPFSFVLGSGQVIAGWDQGVKGMCLGETRILSIPPELGYGDMQMGEIPAGSTLVFKVELVGFNDSPSLVSMMTKAASYVKDSFNSEISQFQNLLSLPSTTTTQE